MLNPKLSFTKVDQNTISLVTNWLYKEHVAKWFHGDGLKNTLAGLDKFVSGAVTQGTYWVVYANNVPFAFLITSYILEQEPQDPSNHLSRWVQPGKKMLTLDMLIGEEDYLSKGLAVKIINEFLDRKFKDIDVVFIDPESTNTKAIHVYKKAGFKEIDSFIAPWHPVPHTLMQLEKGQDGS